MLEKIKSAPLICQIIFYFMCLVIAALVAMVAIFCPIAFFVLIGFTIAIFIFTIFVFNTMFIFDKPEDRDWLLPDFLKILYKKWLDKQNKK